MVTSGFSFEVVDAADYDDLRPGYAPEAVGWVAERGGLGPDSIAVDLAAGTGQLSTRLEEIGVKAIAIEPASNMRRIIAQRQGAIRVVGGAAEALPLTGGSVDAVLVGNAFHHFDRDAAFAEIRRVLRPDGVLALFWAWPLEEEQLRIAGIKEIYAAVERTQAKSRINMAYRIWAEPPDDVEGFGPFERREFRLTHILPSARLADLWATSSDVASLPAPARSSLLARISELARGLPPTLELPARSVVDLCTRSR